MVASRRTIFVFVCDLLLASKLRQNGGFKSNSREGGFSRRSAPDRVKPAEQPVEEIHLEGRLARGHITDTNGARPLQEHSTRVVLSPIG